MNKFFPLLCALVCALPALAQDQAAPATDAPKEFGFSFNFDYSNEKPYAPANITYQREIAGSKPVPFEETVIGKKGVAESEKLSFIDDAGAVLGTLDSTFDESGHLTGQSLTEGKLPARALDWFKTSDQSPALTLGGSAVTARYFVRDGFLSRSVLNIALPSGARALTLNYDELGRREHDEVTSSKGINNVRYLYDQIGLVTIKLAPATATGDELMEIGLIRDKDGKVAEINQKINGVVNYRSTPLYDEKGKGAGNKTELFEDGVLTGIMSVKDDLATVESYKNGVLTTRRKFAKGADGANINISSEEFDANGKLTQSTAFSVDGKALTVTTYNPDGSVKSTQKLTPNK